MGYSLNPLEVFNETDEERIFARLLFENFAKDRIVCFTIYPRKSNEIDVTISDADMDETLTLTSYVNFINGERPKYCPPYKLEEENLIKSIDSLSIYIRQFFEHDLKQVLAGEKWIAIPSYDPRDQSNYH